MLLAKNFLYPIEHTIREMQDMLYHWKYSHHIAVYGIIRKKIEWHSGGKTLFRISLFYANYKKAINKEKTIQPPPCLATECSRVDSLCFKTALSSSSSST